MAANVKFTGWAHARHYEGSLVSGKLIAAGTQVGKETADGLYELSAEALDYVLKTFPEAFTAVGSEPAPPAKPAEESKPAAPAKG